MDEVLPDLVARDQRINDQEGHPDDELSQSLDQNFWFSLKRLSSNALHLPLDPSICAVARRALLQNPDEELQDAEIPPDAYVYQ